MSLAPPAPQPTHSAVQAAAPSDTVALLADIGRHARAAATALTRLKPDVKNRALLAMADAFVAHRDAIRTENAKDTEAARAKGLSSAMIDRLTLTDARIDAMADGLRQVALLDDPVGEVFDMKTRPNGIRVGRMRAPMGVIGFIYESRPNVTADAGGLCVKSGNAIILRGGSEAIHSNTLLARLMDDAGAAAGLPPHAIQLVPTTDRAAVTAMLHMDGVIDLIVPRGGKALIELVMRESRIPVIKHYDGICHVYVHSAADLAMAEAITLNSKTHRTGVCNAQESLLVDAAVADKFLPSAGAALAAKGVTFRADARALPLLPASAATAATDGDFRTEFLDLILAVAVVDGLDDAIAWINEHGSHHTDAIVTADHPAAMRFLNEIDSACVHVNASTRFSDGGEYGLGCEIGISTDKLHARGPMGLKELTTVKWIVFGEGQVRA